MKTYHFKKIILFSILLGSAQVSWAACNQTLSPGANLASAISSAAAGSTICLNSGSYGTTNLTNIVKTSDVIVQSASARGATVNPIISGTQHVKFQNLTIAGAKITKSRYISILNSTFTSQMLVIGSGSSSTLANILIDGNTFDGLKYGGYGEGRLQLYDAGGVTVSNNHFGNAGESDGIQWGGYGGTVGPGNVFDGLIQGSYSAHVDAIQLYGEVNHHTITGNYFRNNTVHFGQYDGGANVSITNNVFDGGSGQPIQIGGLLGGSFSHNTLKGNWNIGNGTKFANTQTRDVTWSNNIFTGGSYINNNAGDQHGCASGCVYSYNIFDSSEKATGTNNIIGTPNFSGGANPTSYASFQLTTSSLGYRAANDGDNMGIKSGGVGTTPPAPNPLSAPANLRVQ